MKFRSFSSARHLLFRLALGRSLHSAVPFRIAPQGNPTDCNGLNAGHFSHCGIQPPVSLRSSKDNDELCVNQRIPEAEEYPFLRW
ncbi:hypothetical protein BX666DRAFT_1951418 [Dichotomocladium elegans]|nr:hypothetical protein BX666DRAFT_1951418 [Dichotomocladium elegans]